MDAVGSEIFTIGHSNHSMETFLGLLERRRIDVVVDVRSAPYSKWVPHFNKRDVERALKAKGFKYLYFGDVMGGRPRDKGFYDADGSVSYGKIAASADFQNSLQRLLNGVQNYRIAIMCSEADPVKCHRHHLIGRCLVEKGVRVVHIREG